MYEGAFAELTKQFVYKLALSHCLIDLHAFRKAECANIFLGLAIAVESCLSLNGFEDRHATVWCLKRYDGTVYLHFWLTVYGNAYFFQHTLCK